MNKKQLEKLGVPQDCYKAAIAAVQKASKSGFRGKQAKGKLAEVVQQPDAFENDDIYGEFAKELQAARQVVQRQPVEYRTWGTDIDQAAHHQMQQACSLPCARAGALMPDAHVGYGLPIGGVLATEGCVVPYAVGVDIACRMKLSLLDLPTEGLTKQFDRFRQALENGTRFGIGSVHEKPKDHEVLDKDWTVSRITREWKDRAHKQLGTSGSGNHFVEFGICTVTHADAAWGVEPGEYVALLSHSGSRGAGASVCSTYSAIAQRWLPSKYAHCGRLAWLDLDTQEGQEYWDAMNLMGDYAAANHDVIHKLVTKLLGAHIVAGVENHHNFAWKERHQGQDWIVHRKGATPAGEGELGVIPGTMADPAYIVRGKGFAPSLNSAAHGAGRCMSRTKASENYNFRAVQKDLEKKGVMVLSAGSDEVPYVYKNIRTVMQAQHDLVEPIARFDPKIVKMCSDGSKAED